MVVMQITPALHKRLLPLYLAAFFQGLVFWYPIEKLFMRGIGFNDALIGIMIATYSTVMLLVETPAGIWADRWSRKGVLMVASVALALSAFTGGISHGVAMFLLSASLWGVFFALYSGANDSIVYDTLEEDGHHADLFEKVFGRVRAVDSLALVVGSLVGGAVATAFGPRVSFFLTIPSALASIAALAWFREPMLHKAKAPVPVMQQIRTTLGAVLKNRKLAPVMGVLILASALEFMMFEFAQVWLLALHAPTAWYGPANAVLLAALAVGGLVAQYVRRYPRLMVGLLLVLLLGAGGLTVLHNVVAVIVAQFMVIVATISLGVYYLRDLHDGLTSQIRNGAASAVSTLGRALIIPLALIFGAVSRGYSVFTAGWFLALAAVGIAGLVWYLEGRRR
jgi:MFS family permease